MRRYIHFLIMAMLVLLPGNMLLAQDGAVTLDREDFPPVQVARVGGECLVTIESVGLPFAGYSLLSPFQRTITEFTGTGVIVSPDGYIITAPENVRDAEFLKVTYNGVEYDATVEKIDEYYDLALIRIDASGLPSVNWGDSDLVQRGEPVVVMGAPEGLERTLTYGFVTNIRDFRVVGPRGYDGMLILSGFVIDAALHSGVQTGPVYNRNGECIGIVSRKSGGGEENIGYVLPSNLVSGVVDQLITVGQVCHPWLGIFPYLPYNRTLAVYMGIPIDEVDPETGEMYDVVGILVDGVAAGSPAAMAGIVRGDLLLRANDKLLRTVKDLEITILNTGCGEEVNLVIIRNFELRYVPVEIADKPVEYENIYLVGRDLSI